MCGGAYVLKVWVADNTSLPNLQLSVQLYVTECFLIFALVSMLALIMMQGSKVTKMFGVVLLIIFVGYLVTIVILEFFFGGKPNLLSLPMID